MEAKTVRIPANQDEITLYTFLGETLCTIQYVELGLSHSITIKMNPTETKEKANEILKQHLSFTLGKAIKLAIKENLYCSTLQEELNDFLIQRNWLVHKSMFEIQRDLHTNDKKEELFKKIKSISDKAVSIHQEIENDLIEFCIAKGKDMSKIVALLNLQKQGVRVKM